MSAKEDFPEIYSSSTPDGVFYYSEAPEIYDWLRRCMIDAPVEYNPCYADSVIDWHNWYEKWFGQFRNKCQK